MYVFLLIVKSPDYAMSKAISKFKVLEIIKGVFENCDVFYILLQSLNPTSVIYDIIAPHVFPALSSENPRIKKIGIECLALYSLSDKVS
jgi:hypothetical protein